MNRTSIAFDTQLHVLLAQDGPCTVNDLRRFTGKSQASLSMALTRLGVAVCKMGAARATRYALTQAVLGLDARQALHLSGPHADQGLFGELVFLHGNHVHVRGPRKSEWDCRDALPWWLSTLRPQGFLGRQYARLRPDFAPDPDHWTLAQTLYTAANHFHNPPGAFSMGSASGVPAIAIPRARRGSAFDKLAEASALGLPAGSSAGGEQPKFVCQVEDVQVVVKFTPTRGTPFGERWHELLHLEHLANTLLREKGIACAQTEVVTTRKRSYLQSSRFDRIGAAGKRHVVAAAALHDAFVKSPRRHWVATSEDLAAQKMLAPEHVRTIASSYLFGQYIGNTDMHFGNLSFFVDDVTRPVLLPTPVYDMLPMLWRPGVHGGELDPAQIQPQRQPVGFDTQAGEARAWAIEYWERAAAWQALGSTLRAAATRSAKALR